MPISEVQQTDCRVLYRVCGADTQMQRERHLQQIVGSYRSSARQFPGGSSVLFDGCGEVLNWFSDFLRRAEIELPTTKGSG